MLTKQHYEAIAKIIKQNTLNTLPEPCHDTAIRIEGIELAGKWISLALAEYFADDSTLFDRSKFLAACGIE